MTPLVLIVIMFTSNCLAQRGIEVESSKTLFDCKKQENYFQQLIKNPDFWVTRENIYDLLYPPVWHEVEEIQSLSKAHAPEDYRYKPGILIEKKYLNTYLNLRKQLEETFSIYTAIRIEKAIDIFKKNPLLQQPFSPKQPVQKFTQAEKLEIEAMAKTMRKESGISTKSKEEKKQSLPKDTSSTLTMQETKLSDYELFSLASEIFSMHFKYQITELDKNFVLLESSEMIPGTRKDYQRYLEAKEHLSKNPFFKLIRSIGECTTCAISRIENPFIRNHFENSVVAYTVKNFPNKSAPLIITAFASGNLYQIFIIVNMLVAQGYKAITLNFLDLIYDDFVNRYKKSPQPVALDLGVEIYPKIATDPQGKPIIKEEHLDVVLKSNRRMEIYKLVDESLIKDMFITFVQWFNCTPAKVRVIAYKDAQDYIDDCKKDSSLKSDLILAADYFVPLIPIMDNLRKETLQSTGRAFSLLHGLSPKTSTFYYSEGNSIDASMEHQVWDFSTKKLLPIKEIPQNIDVKATDALFNDIKNHNLTLENLKQYVNNNSNLYESRTLTIANKDIKGKPLELIIALSDQLPESLTLVNFFVNSLGIKYFSELHINGIPQNLTELLAKNNSVALLAFLLTFNTTVPHPSFAQTKELRDFLELLYKENIIYPPLSPDQILQFARKTNHTNLIKQIEEGLKLTQQDVKGHELYYDLQNLATTLAVFSKVF